MDFFGKFVPFFFIIFYALPTVYMARRALKKEKKLAYILWFSSAVLVLLASWVYLYYFITQLDEYELNVLYTSSRSSVMRVPYAVAYIGLQLLTSLMIITMVVRQFQKSLFSTKIQNLSVYDLWFISSIIGIVTAIMTKM